MMLDKIAEQMEYNTVDVWPEDGGDRHIIGLIGRVLLIAQRSVDSEIDGQKYVEPDLDYYKSGIVRDIHSFFYGELKADLKGVRRATKNILKYVPSNNPGQETDTLALMKAIDNLIEKIG